MKHLQVAGALLLLCGMGAGAGAAETYVVENVWESRGAGPGQFGCPSDIALDYNGNTRIDLADVVWLFNNL